jgi:hypothetical protein
MSGASTCPDWPQLMELDPTLQFRHYSVLEARLPTEVLIRITHESLSGGRLCADLEHHVFNAPHTDPAVGDALEASDWLELREWAPRRDSA